MGDRVVEFVKHRLFVQDLKLKQLQNQQLSTYLQSWVLMVEAVFFGIGVGLGIAVGVRWYSEGLSSAIAVGQTVATVAIVTVAVLTVLFRVLWTVSSQTTVGRSSGKAVAETEATDDTGGETSEN